MTITHGRLTDSDLRLFPKQGQAKKGTKASEMKLGVVSQRRDFDGDFRSDCPTVHLAGRGVGWRPKTSFHPGSLCMSSNPNVPRLTQLSAAFVSISNRV